MELTGEDQGPDPSPTAIPNLIYSHNGAIRSKIIKGNQVVDSDRVIPNETNVEGDKVRKTSTDDIDYWYG
jgi:hypothetical protein